MKMNKRIFFYLFLLILIGFVIYRVVSQFDEMKQKNTFQSKAPIEEELTLPVKTKPVERGEINSFLKVTGVIEANDTVRVTSEIMGQVKEVRVHEGEEVNKGNVLVTLEDEQLKIQVAQAQATFDSAQAYYEKIKAGARPQEIKKSESALLQAKVNRDSAEENYIRMQKLYSEKVISKQEYETAESQYRIAEAQYQSAEESYALVMEGAAEEDLKSAEAQVRQAQAALDIAKYQLSNTKIAAPLKGKVTSVAISPGEMVSVATPLLSIIDVSRMLMKVGISEKDISKVAEGQKVNIAIDAFPDREFQGKVFSKSVAVDQISKTLEVKIEIIQPGVEIPVGVFARGDIVVKTVQDALIVPSNALVRKEKAVYVYIIEDGIARQREVTLGTIQDEQIEIVEGLTENEEVVILGNQELKDGSKVSVLEKEE